MKVNDPQGGVNDCTEPEHIEQRESRGWRDWGNDRQLKEERRCLFLLETIDLRKLLVSQREAADQSADRDGVEPLWAELPTVSGEAGLPFDTTPPHESGSSTAEQLRLR